MEIFGPLVESRAALLISLEKYFPHPPPFPLFPPPPSPPPLVLVNMLETEMLCKVVT